MLAFALFAIYGLLGYIVDAVLLSNNKSTRSEKKDEMLSAFISMSYVNNILVAVFAEQFFGSQVAALAALYNIPYYIGILLLARFVTNPRHSENLIEVLSFSTSCCCWHSEWLKPASCIMFSCYK